MDPARRLEQRLRDDLSRAMKERDTTAISVLRTTISAIANAEAPPLVDGGPKPSIGLVDHPRLALTDADLDRILRHEIADREDTIERFERGGKDAEAAELRAEIGILQRYLG